MNRLIEHAILEPTTTLDDIRRACANAREFNFAAVCVNSCWVPAAANFLSGSKVRVVATVGYPLGAMATAAKLAEARQAIADGASEIKTVVNLGWLTSNDIASILTDIRQVALAASGRPVTVVLESHRMNTADIQIACQLAIDGGAQFVQTSSGFDGNGTAPGDVQRIRDALGPRLEIKAMFIGRSQTQAQMLIDAGAVCIVTGSPRGLFEDP